MKSGPAEKTCSNLLKSGDKGVSAVFWVVYQFH